jgi:hypothetical protein
MVEKLPDSYAKDATSNNYKLLSCIAPEFEEIAVMFKSVSGVMDIDSAYGGILDKLAVNVNQQRGQVNDTTLRTLIKAKIASDMSEGTVKTLFDVIGFIIGDSENQTEIVELWNDDTAPEAAALRIIAPLASVIESGLTLGHFTNIVSRIRSAGVRIDADIQGTFEFGDVSEYGGEYDTGFADEEQTVGGTLGILYDTDGDDPLPI